MIGDALIDELVDGALIRGRLADFGVELLPTITPRGTGIARSERVDGEPHYTFSESMVQRTIAFDAAQRAAIADADIVAVSGFPFDVPAQVELLARAVDGRPHVAVDPNPRPGLLHDADAFKRALEAFGGTAQLIKLGDDDVRLLWNEPVAELAPRLLARYPYVLVTEGKAGVALRGGDVSTWGLDPEPGELRGWTLDNLRAYWKPLMLRTETGRGALGAGTVEWRLLGPARIQATIATGEVISKREAGERALALFPHHAPILGVALAHLRGEDVRSAAPRSEWRRLTVACMREIIAEAERLPR